MKKLIGLLIVVLMFYCAFLGYQISDLKKQISYTGDDQNVTYVNKTITGFSTDLTKVVEDISPQIVRINAYHASSSYTGSGILYLVNENETIVVTNAHGIKSALDVSVTFHNGESVSAETVGVDELTDLAVLRTNPSFTSTPAVQGSTSTLSLGEWVIAVGNDIRTDFYPSVSVGVVSGKNRLYKNETQSDSIYNLNVVIADLDITEGTTGGAVVNMQGEVIGIPSTVLSEDVAVIVPIEEISEVVRLLMEYQQVVRPVLGISTQQVSVMNAYQKSQLSIQLDQIDGLYIHSVKHGGPCDVATIVAGDILLEMNGTKVSDYNTLRALLYACKPQDVVELTILRGTETMKVMVTLQ